MIRTLIVGGTGFLGVEIARAALAHGHQVSILTRGPTVPIPGVTTITADRFGPLDMLQDQDFDLVFDTCAYVPKAVTHLLRNVASARYVMISSISVHPRFDLPALSKDTPVTSATAADLALQSGRAFCRLGQRADERRRLWPAETCLRNWPQSRLWRTKRSCGAPGCWRARATAVTG